MTSSDPGREVPVTDPASGPEAGDPHSLPPVRIAREMLAARRMRAEVFDADLFGEPAWDILLELFVAGEEGTPVALSSAGIGSMVPPTTALRWLRLLEERGIVLRRLDPADGRRTHVALSEAARARLATLLNRGTALIR